MATILISICSSAYSFPADVKPLNDSAYFKTVYSLISKAERSVYVIMYHATYYDKYQDSYSNKLIKSLIAAKKRGCDVKVILDRQEQKKGVLDRAPDNEIIANKLLKEGVRVYLDDEKITTHSKLIIIDSRFTVVGSTNWTYPALGENNETNALIDSEQIAKEYMKYFDDLATLCK